MFELSIDFDSARPALYCRSAAGIRHQIRSSEIQRRLATVVLIIDSHRTPRHHFHPIDWSVIHRLDTGLVLISVWLLRKRKPSQQENDSEMKQSLDHNDLRANASLRCIRALERLGALFRECHYGWQRTIRALLHM